jgi:hypothetical protein
MTHGIEKHIPSGDGANCMSLRNRCGLSVSGGLTALRRFVSADDMVGHHRPGHAMASGTFQA